MIRRVTGQQYILWNFSVLTFLILQELIFQQINLLLMNNDLTKVVIRMSQIIIGVTWGHEAIVSAIYMICEAILLMNLLVLVWATMFLLDKLPQLCPVQ